MILICLNKFIGRCPDCRPDLDVSHHPNNLDCPRFKKMTICEFTVIDPENSSKNTLQNSVISTIITEVIEAQKNEEATNKTNEITESNQS